MIIKCSLAIPLVELRIKEILGIHVLFHLIYQIIIGEVGYQFIEISNIICCFPLQNIFQIGLTFL